MAGKKGGPRNKYDWAKYKSEFMLSDDLDVTSYFKRVYGGYPTYFQKQTIGWLEEKKERQKKIAERVLKDNEDKEVQNLKKALGNVRAYFQLKVQDGKALEKLTVRDAKRIWEVLRTENDLPCKIMKSESTVFNKNDEDEVLRDLEDDEGEIKN